MEITISKTITVRIEVNSYDKKKCGYCNFYQLDRSFDSLTYGREICEQYDDVVIKNNQRCEKCVKEFGI